MIRYDSLSGILLARVYALGPKWPWEPNHLDTTKTTTYCYVTSESGKTNSERMHTLHKKPVNRSNNWSSWCFSDRDIFSLMVGSITRIGHVLHPRPGLAHGVTNTLRLTKHWTNLRQFVDFLVLASAWNDQYTQVDQTLSLGRVNIGSVSSHPLQVKEEERFENLKHIRWLEYVSHAIAIRETVECIETCRIQ